MVRDHPLLVVIGPSVGSGDAGRCGNVGGVDESTGAGIVLGNPYVPAAASGIGDAHQTGPEHTALAVERDDGITAAAEGRPASSRGKRKRNRVLIQGGKWGKVSRPGAKTSVDA